MPDDILVIGSDTCWVSTLIMRRMVERGVSFSRADYSDFERIAARVDFRADQDGDSLSFFYFIEQLELSSTNFKSVFYRHTGPRRSLREEDLGLSGRASEGGGERYWSQYQRFVASALTYLCETCFSVQLKDEGLSATNKLMQLGLARELGFPIPKTYIGSDPDEMHAFVSSNDKTISKAFMPRQIYWQGKSFITMTSTVTAEDLESLAHSPYPVCLQEAISDKLDIRVGIVGNKIFATEIGLVGVDSSDEVVDFRQYEWYQAYGMKKGTQYRAHALPEDVQERCFAFVRALGLQYSMMDLLRTPDGTYHFLENNHQGMHGEVEGGGHDVIGAMVDLLVDPETNRLR